MPYKPDKPSFMAPHPSREGVEEFKELYRQKYVVELGGEEALHAAIHLLHLLYFGLTPPPDKLKDDLKQEE